MAKFEVRESGIYWKAFVVEAKNEEEASEVELTLDKLIREGTRLENTVVEKIS